MAERPLEELSPEELSEEIKREAETLEESQRGLREAITRRGALEEELEAERQPEREERVRRGSEAIRRLEARIARLEEGYARRQEIIDHLRERVRVLEARLTRIISPVERFITRETIRRLRRSIAAYEGWQTRYRTWLTHDRLSLRAYQGWQTREEPYARRVSGIRTELEYYTSQITSLRAEIATEEERLKRKRELLPKWWKSHIIISVQYKEPPHQKFFEVHVIMPSTVPEITEETAEAKTAISLAVELILEYFAIKALDESKFLRKNEFVFGEVQTSPVDDFNEVTECCIFDVKTRGAPARQYFKVYWRKPWTETTLTGERVEHPIAYTRIEVIEKDLSKVTTETFELTYKGLVAREK